jgi:hypothetical protein
MAEAMAVKIKIIEHRAFLEVLATGQHDLQDTVDKLLSVFSVCRTSDKSKVLIDFHKMKDRGGSEQKLIYTHYFKEHYDGHLAAGGKELKVAYFDTRHRTGTYNPGLEAAKALGLSIDLFASRRDALIWLCGEEQRRPLVGLLKRAFSINRDLFSSTRNFFSYYVISCLAGIALFLVFSTASKLLAGSNPFVLRGLFVPMIVGAVGGVVMGRSRRKLLVVNNQLKDIVHDLESLLPICASCKKIRRPGADPEQMGSWISIEAHLRKDGSRLTHGICPDCMRKYYPDIDLDDE